MSQDRIEDVLKDIKSNQTNGTQICKINATISADIVNVENIRILSGTIGALTSGLQKSQIVSVNGTVADVSKHDGCNALVVHTPDIYVSGTMATLGATIEKTVMGQGSAIMSVSGIWTGKVLFEGSIDGSTWNNLSVVQPAGTMTFNGVQNDNQNGLYRVPTTSGYTLIRTRMSSYTSGAVRIKINTSQPVGWHGVYQLNRSNFNANVTQFRSTGVEGGMILDGLTGTVGGTVTAEVDRQIRALNIIQSEHHEIHEGHSFRGTSYVSGIGSNAIQYWNFKSPNVYHAHLVYDFSSAINGTFKVYKDVTIGNNGTSIPLLNANLNMSATTSAAFYVSPTTISGTTGNLIDSFVVGSDGANVSGRGGSNTARSAEWVLKPNTKYLFQFDNITTGGRANLKIEFYEGDKPHMVGG